MSRNPLNVFSVMRSFSWRRIAVLAGVVVAGSFADAGGPPGRNPKSELAASQDSSAKDVSLLIAGLERPLVFSAADSDRSESGECPEMWRGRIHYWGTGPGIAALTDAVPTFDPDAPGLRKLPLGVAPLSPINMPRNSRFDAIAVLCIEGEEFVLLADANELVGVRFASELTAPDTAPVQYDVTSVDGAVFATGCTANAGCDDSIGCKCTASDEHGESRCLCGQTTGGVEWAECTDGRQATRCEYRNGICECRTTQLEPTP